MSDTTKKPEAAERCEASECSVLLPACPNCEHDFCDGENDLVCDRCGKLCCAMCTEDDEEDCYKVVCDECLGR